LFTPALEINPLEFVDETYPQKLEGWGYRGENFIIVTSTVFD